MPVKTTSFGKRIYTIDSNDIATGINSDDEAILDADDYQEQFNAKTTEDVQNLLTQIESNLTKRRVIIANVTQASAGENYNILRKTIKKLEEYKDKLEPILRSKKSQASREAIGTRSSDEIDNLFVKKTELNNYVKKEELISAMKQSSQVLKEELISAMKQSSQVASQKLQELILPSAPASEGGGFGGSRRRRRNHKKSHKKKIKTRSKGRRSRRH